MTTFDRLITKNSIEKKWCRKNRNPVRKVKFQKKKVMFEK